MKPGCLGTRSTAVTATKILSPKYRNHKTAWPAANIYLHYAIPTSYTGAEKY